MTIGIEWVIVWFVSAWVLGLADHLRGPEPLEFSAAVWVFMFAPVILLLAFIAAFAGQVKDLLK